MLHPGTAYDIAAEQRKARLARAAAIAQVRAAQPARRGRSVPRLLSRSRPSLRPRMA
ncbi:MAG TPA: hypothetical protein VEF71_26535 [Streptosporangiaceae bacterium]|nr:hypothetical protein [Streptosporangiaceae bacterium]